VTHPENMVRAGIIPTPNPSLMDTGAAYIDTVGPTGTAGFDIRSNGDNGVVPLINEDSIKAAPADTSSALIPVSIVDSVPKGASRVTGATRVLITPRPCRADPCSPICTMDPPPALEPVQRPERHEASCGAKEDLNVDDWTRTEFGDVWWRQTDEELRNRSVNAQTETMREEGEFLHWYRVTPTNPENVPTFMSARTGPEACVKVERCFGKGWAHS
jgi:hypothetical protein